ncbi:MAG: hypothetical protein ACR2PO_13045 [Methyloligellaceae bacterium]
MATLVPSQANAATELERPVLHLSGPILTRNLEQLIAACEELGGIEVLANAIKLKATLFQEILRDGKAESLTLDLFEQLCPFMATCRRRVAKPLQAHGFAHFRDAIVVLLDGAGDATTADYRLTDFVDRFPSEKSYRWVRDLAAEILHHVSPEQYPLMTRWIWDAKANTGVLREIWHGDNVDHMMLDVPDSHATFVMLREELSQFLADNGVFRDMLFYVDLLQAYVYADYINAQGGTYLRTDFASEVDPLLHTRRILGLDGVDRQTGRSRFKTIDGEAHMIGKARRLT